MSTLHRMRLAYRVIRRVFGVRVAPLFTGVLFGVLRGAVALFMGLDALLPRLRRTRVTRPIVIVGSPRTGTTFLQRFLHRTGVGTGMQLWRMLYPSVLLQKLLRPLLPLLERVSPARHHSTVAHATSLTSVETDDAGIFLRFFDGFFLYGFFLAWDDEDHRGMVDPAVRDTSARDYDWLERVWRRNLAATGGERVVAKMFSLSTRMQGFFERFPDARVLYMVRDPVDVIPSGMSLVTGVLDKRFGVWSLPEATRRRYLDRLYDAFVELLRRFHDDYTGGAFDRERVYLVRYDRMMREFEVVMDEILAHVGTPKDAALEAAIREQAEKQRAYSSEHKYSLEKFGLDRARIQRDCAFMYETFGIPREPDA
ncbi:MAG: sulfotransferase [Myxococcales bacterium]|nr:sulfotransferase [Myxococcales bacterium]MCB9751873.1 sulfotransferase [Myxococcales bacterium]